MKFCPVVSEICNGHVHVARKERIIIIIIIIITKIIIIIRNGAKTISLQTLFGRLKYLYRLKTKFINISQNILEK
jgi:hypothetical protein